MNRLCAGIISILTLAAGIPAGYAQSDTFTFKDAPAIVDASRHNEPRFDRDFKNHLFSDNGILKRITADWTKGWYFVEVIEPISDNEVDCHIQLSADEVARWPANAQIRIAGRLKDTLMGDLLLKDNCAIKVLHLVDSD